MSGLLSFIRNKVEVNLKKTIDLCQNCAIIVSGILNVRVGMISQA